MMPDIMQDEIIGSRCMVLVISVVHWCAVDVGEQRMWGVV